MKTFLQALGTMGLLIACAVSIRADDAPASGASKPASGGIRTNSVRVAAVQARNRTIDWKIEDSAEVLRRVDQTLDDLEKLIDRAAEAHCDAVAFPEDTLGLLNWEAAHGDRLKEVLPKAVDAMLQRLGRAASRHRMNVVVCADAVEPDGKAYNTAILLGRDGREVGRYHKVNLPLSEQSLSRGSGFPVFPTPDLGVVGMAICYDMVFPETTRCLALAGADVVFVSTLGGAAFGDGDLDKAAFRVRAVDNFIWLIVARRGGGSMVISPMGDIVAESTESDGMAIADIQPWSGRQSGDAFNTQPDMRGRLFRERVPQAYGILTDTNAPVLAKVPSNVTAEEAIRLMHTALTSGEERFKAAAALARAGKTEEALRAFEALCTECRTSWIERESRKRIESLRASKP